MKKKIFISYCRADGHRVYPLIELLRASGVKVFLDIDSIEYGDQWEKMLETSVIAAERVLVFWSKSAEKSKYVKYEYLLALKVGVRIIPVQLDSTPLPQPLAQFQALTELLPLLDRLEKTKSFWQRISSSWNILLIIPILVALIFLNLKITQYLFYIVLVILIIVIMMRNIGSPDTLTTPDEIAEQIDKMLFDDVDSGGDDNDDEVDD